MIRYLIIHNKHEGCYDFHCYQDEVARIRLTSITINPPKIYMFTSRDEAQDFFEEYINDVDCIDNRCKKGEDVEHVDYCTCGVIELDNTGEPVLFYNKKNQIFLMEHGPQMFVPNFEVKSDAKNLNLTNKLIRKCKSLNREQRQRYIELGKYCEECNSESNEGDNEENHIVKSDEPSDKTESTQLEINDDDEPEIKVLKAIPSEGITLDELIYKVGEPIRDGMSICLKNKWIYKNGDLIMRATPENFKKYKEEKKEEENTEEFFQREKEKAQQELEKEKEKLKELLQSKKEKEKDEKPKTVRKKKTDEEGNTKEKKPRAPRKKKTDESESAPSV